MSNDFVVRLLSKDLAPFSHSKFSTKLARTLIFDGRWEVGIKQIVFPRQSFNLNKEYQFAVAFPVDGTPDIGNILSDIDGIQPRPAGYSRVLELREGALYDDFALDISDLNMTDHNNKWKFVTDKINTHNNIDEDEIVELFADTVFEHYRSSFLRHQWEITKTPSYYVTYDKRRGRVTLHPQHSKFIVLAPAKASIIQLLGFGLQAHKFTARSGIEYEYLFVPKDDPIVDMIGQSKVTIMKMSTIVVLSDIVTDPLFGETQANILGLIHANREAVQHGVFFFESLDNIPLKHREISSIEIDLRRVTGEPIRTYGGQIMCVLKFHRTSDYR